MRLPRYEQADVHANSHLNARFAANPSCLRRSPTSTPLRRRRGQSSRRNLNRRLSFPRLRGFLFLAFQAGNIHHSGEYFVHVANINQISHFFARHIGIVAFHRGMSAIDNGRNLFCVLHIAVKCTNAALQLFQCAQSDRRNNIFSAVQFNGYAFNSYGHFVFLFWGK
nr:MAG TPA: hypothetical protein [Caudoviricetes sp.]